jgi:hypothetical protein
MIFSFFVKLTRQKFLYFLCLNLNLIFAFSQENSTTIDSSFVIKNNLKDHYEATILNGIKNGYFINDTLKSFEIKLVDYYEANKLIYRYSHDFTNDNENEYGKHYLNIKTTFKNNKVYDGLNYTMVSRGLLIDYYSLGILKKINLHVFAMHYYNCLVFEIKKNNITIKSLENRNSKIELSINENKQWQATQFFNDAIVNNAIWNGFDTEKTYSPNCKLKFFNNKYIFQPLKDSVKSIEISDYDDIRTVNKIFQNLILNENINNYYNQFKHLSKYCKKQDIVNLLLENQEDVITGIGHTDKLGKIKYGFFWFDEFISYYIFIKNNTIITRKNCNYLEFYKTINNYD